MRTHLFVVGPHRTWAGSRICDRPDCGEPEWHRVHEVRSVSVEAKELDERRLGEARAGHG